MSVDRSVIDQLNRHENQLRAIIEQIGPQNPTIVQPDGTVIDVGQLASTVTAIQNTLDQQISITAQALVDEKMQQITEAVAAVNEMKDQVDEMANSRTRWGRILAGSNSGYYSRNEGSQSTFSSSHDLGYTGNRERVKIPLSQADLHGLRNVKVLQAIFVFYARVYSSDFSKPHVDTTFWFGESTDDAAGWWTGQTTGLEPSSAIFDPAGWGWPTSGNTNRFHIFNVPLTEAAIDAWVTNPQYCYYLGGDMTSDTSYTRYLRVYTHGYRRQNYSNGETYAYNRHESMDWMATSDSYMTHMLYQYELPSAPTVIV